MTSPWARSERWTRSTWCSTRASPGLCSPLCTRSRQASWRFLAASGTARRASSRCTTTARSRIAARCHTPSSKRENVQKIVGIFIYCRWFHISLLYDSKFALQRDLSAPISWWQQAICDELILPHFMTTIWGQRTKIGGGVFLTEFGLCMPDAYNNSINTVECQSTVAEVHYYSIYCYSLKHTLTESLQHVQNVYLKSKTEHICRRIKRSSRGHIGICTRATRSAPTRPNSSAHSDESTRAQWPALCSKSTSIRCRARRECDLYSMPPQHWTAVACLLWHIRKHRIQILSKLPQSSFQRVCTTRLTGSMWTSLPRRILQLYLSDFSIHLKENTKSCKFGLSEMDLSAYLSTL